MVNAMRYNKGMNKQRIESNIKNLETAKKLVILAFEDLKNIREFRNSIPGGLIKRSHLLTQMDLVIDLAKLLAEKSET